MVTQRNGRAATIRAFLKEHPNCTAREIIAALPFPHQDIRRELSRMCKAGTVVAEGIRRHTLFNLGRDVRPAKPQHAPPPKAHPMRQAIRTNVRPERKSGGAPMVRGQTVAEYLANGGKVEVLPTHWDAAPHARPYVPPHGRSRTRGAA